MKKSTILIALAAAAALACALVPEVAAAAQAFVAYVGPENLSMLSLAGTTATTVVQNPTYTGAKPVNTQPRGAALYPILIPIEFPAAAPVANDIHLLCKLLPNVEVEDYSIDLDDLDTDVSPAASLSLGEANAALTDVTVVYKSGITIGQSGGLLRYAASTAATTLRAIQATTLANERVLALKWDTASATYAASKKGLLTLWVRG